MIPPGTTLGGLLLAAHAFGTAQSLSADWKHWRFFRTVELEEGREPRLAHAVLPMDVFGDLQESLADLRIIDQDDHEVSARRTQRSRQWLAGRIAETGFVPGEYNQLIVDTGGGALHTCIEARSEEADFFAWVEVSVNSNPFLQTTPYRVVLRQEPDASCRLLYGNSRAREPNYDMKRLTSRTELQSSLPGRLGAKETNDGYMSPEPWTERHPAILWVALVAALLALGFLAIRSLRRISTANDE